MHCICPSDNGTMVETCILSFIPVGSDIKEIENCTVSTGGSDLASAIVTPSASASSVTISFIPAPTVGTLGHHFTTPLTVPHRGRCRCQ